MTICTTDNTFGYISNKEDGLVENSLDAPYEVTSLGQDEVEEGHISIPHEMELDENITESNIDGNELLSNCSDARSSINEHDSIIMEETEDEDVQSDVDFITETEQVIVDQAQPSFKGVEGQYSPYFSDYTSMMLYTWITKHQICMLTLYYFL